VTDIQQAVADEIAKLKVELQPIYTASGLTPRAELLIAMLVLVGLLVFLWDRFTPSPAPVGVTVIAAPNKALNNVQKIDVPVKKLRVYDAPAKAKVSVPQPVKDDPNQYVLGSTSLKPGTHPTTVTTTVNADTGESTTYTTREPYPWFAFENQGDIGIGVGFDQTGATVGMIEVHEDLVQIKAAHLGVTAIGMSNRTGFVGLSARMKW
jgi:hypothetical protein